MKTIKKTITIMLILALVFTALPMMGAFDVQAKSKKKKVPKNITLSGYASGYNTIVLNWNKIKSPQKGYAVFMDGACIAYCGKKTTSYAVSVGAGSTHSFQIKTWKKVKKTKKIKGKKKKVTTYKYGKKSKAITVTTPRPAPVATQQTAPSTPAPSPTPTPTTNRAAITVTDYKGDKTTLYKDGNKTYLYPTGGNPMTRNELAKVNKNVDGTWDDGNYTFYQKNGTTLEYKSK